MSYRGLRFLAGLLNFLGWVLVIGGTGLGFLPWILSTMEPMPVAPRWQSLVTYGSPVAGFLLGLFAALGFFLLAQLIRVWLDMRDALEAIWANTDSLLVNAQNSASPPVMPQPQPAVQLEAEEKTL